MEVCELQTALITGGQVIVMFLLMAVGFTMTRMKMLTPDGSTQLNKLLLNVVTPAVLLNSFNRDFEWGLFGSLGICMLLCAASIGIAVAVAFIFVHGRDELRRTERFAVCFSNCGFFGIPLVAAVLGQDAVIYASCGITAFNLGCWTFGRIMLTGGGGSAGAAIKKVLLNPGVIGVVLGLALFFSPIKLPSPIAGAVGHLANLNTPVAMIVVGSFMARADLKAALRSFGVWKVCFLRLVVIPALTLPLCLLFKSSEAAATASFIINCCPVAAVASMFPNLFGMVEGEKYGSALVSVSTLLSAATIPLLMLAWSSLV